MRLPFDRGERGWIPSLFISAIREIRGPSFGLRPAVLVHPWSSPLDLPDLPSQGLKRGKFLERLPFAITNSLYERIPSNQRRDAKSIVALNVTDPKPAPSDAFLPTRDSLLSRLRAWDDQESWNEFFALYGKLIYNLAAQAGLSDAEAQDVVQETVISVAKEMPDFNYDPARGSFKSWLRRIVQRRIADSFRRQPREGSLGSIPSGTDTGTGLEGTQPDPSADRLDSIWEQEWQKHLLETALKSVRKKVSSRQFQIFDLHVLQEVSVAKVVEILNVNFAQVYLAKHRISRLLRKEVYKLKEMTET